MDTCCLQQGSPVETQTFPRETNHLSLPLPEAGNGTMHRVRSFLLFFLGAHIQNITPSALVWALRFRYSVLHWRVCFCCLLAFRHTEVDKFNTNRCLRFLYICRIYLSSECPQLSAVQFSMFLLPKKACKEPLKSILMCACEFPVWVMFLMVFPYRIAAILYII